MRGCQVDCPAEVLRLVRDCTADSLCSLAAATGESQAYYHIMSTGWKALHRPELGLANSVSDCIARRSWAVPGSLPDFRKSDRLVVACDYSGEPKSYRYRSISVLIADGRALWVWDALRSQLRGECFREQRRIGFKNVTERQRSAALVPFLRAANTIPGLLFTLLIDKQISTLFRQEDELDGTGANLFERCQALDPISRERFFQLSHMVGISLHGLSHPAQDILVVTDEDSIVANESRLRLLCEAMARITSNYLTHTLGRLQVCTTKSDTGRLDLEDLTAIPDLAGGSITECAGLRDERGGLTPGVLRPLDQTLSKKTRAISAWYAEYWHPLKRVSVLLDSLPDDGICARLLDIQPEAPIKEYDWRNDVSVLLQGK